MAQTRRLSCMAILSLAHGWLAVVAASPTPPANWPAFRGTNAAGVAEGAALPVEWDVPPPFGIWRPDAACATDDICGDAV